MEQNESPSVNPPDAGSSSSMLDWKLKDYGNGPEPPRGSPDWMRWIEEQAVNAAADHQGPPTPWMLKKQAEREAAAKEKEAAVQEAEAKK